MFINRGTPESPRPYAIAADAGQLLCIFSSAARAQLSAQQNGLLAEGETLTLFAIPLPAAIDWALALGQHGVTGVTIDYPHLGTWTPLQNLSGMRDQR